MLIGIYPGRISLGLGTGEAMNEVSVGFDWPSSEIRLKRTIEAIQIIKKLWNKEGQGDKETDQKDSDLSNKSNIDEEGFVTFDGEYYKTKSAKLYTLLKIFLYILLLQDQRQLKLQLNILMD